MTEEGNCVFKSLKETEHKKKVKLKGGGHFVCFLQAFEDIIFLGFWAACSIEIGMTGSWLGRGRCRWIVYRIRACSGERKGT
jgi:hypothetical protein